ncbi:MAG TPA: hypothetical protein PLJ78_11775 [Anaerolineae bacterium]|nr:hypothetical protein [Anaerolineae bacterium]HQK14607.1 hypothetical protein [Anaerolineae bacterium]
MHWILTPPDTFTLTQVIRRSQWLLQPPFSVNRAKDHLNRVERLESGDTIDLSISQVPAGLLIQTHERLGGKETEEVSHKVWRMLRLGENLQPFLEVARHVQGLESVLKDGAQILRGATLFEDVVKAVIFTMGAKNVYGPYITWLVDRFGDPLPSNPTRHAFPTPQQILLEQDVLDEVLEPAIAYKLMEIAGIFYDDEKHLIALAESDLPLQELTAHLSQCLGLNAAAMGLVMLSLGRYDYIPTDAYAQQRILQHQKSIPVTAKDIYALFEPLQPWGGLAFWLWDWSAAPPTPPYTERHADGKDKD